MCYLDYNPENGNSVTLVNSLREAVIVSVPVDEVKLQWRTGGLTDIVCDRIFYEKHANSMKL
ncbi:hypothetical protein DPMN_180657 [Dreissena polymorpha]|uniref:Uncharacterized protein n=1 Tax=Dreissena polymorpha TaxID=45954 RepID=A0A9D4IPK2_DREPO|nr:hypothetical protein DPMN_180657 [Dreissena polymorpha]